MKTSARRRQFTNSITPFRTEQEEESKTNGKSITGQERRAKCLRAEKQNRDNTVSENSTEGDRINVLTVRCTPGKRGCMKRANELARVHRPDLLNRSDDSYDCRGAEQILRGRGVIIWKLKFEIQDCAMERINGDQGV